MGGAGALLLASRNLGLNAAGFGVLYLAFLLDKVDGELARYRGVQSVRATLLDRLHHLLVEPTVLVAAAWRQRQLGGGDGPMVLALIAIVLGNIIEEQQHLSPYAWIKFVREVRRHPAPGARRDPTLERASTLMRPLK